MGQSLVGELLIKFHKLGVVAKIFFLKRKERDAVVLDIRGAWYLGVLVPL